MTKEQIAERVKQEVSRRLADLPGGVKISMAELTYREYAETESVAFNFLDGSMVSLMIYRPVKPA